VIGTGGGALGTALLAACAPRAREQAAAGAVTGTTEFWQWGTGYNPGFQTLTDEFNARRTGVTVKFVPSTGDYWNKLTAALAGNVGPDVFLMNTNARSWAAQGQLQDLTSLINKDKSAARDHAAALKAYDEWYRIEGKITGWPWDYSTIATAYNALGRPEFKAETHHRQHLQPFPSRVGWAEVAARAGRQMELEHTA